MVQSRLWAALAYRYRLERELGEGGMATVYAAQDLKHNRRVAIKVLRPELANSLGSERFLREIEIAAGLHHPHILPLYDSGGVGDELYYVMPLVEGESLRDRLRREKQLPFEEAMRYALEVADALSYAHAHGVVHRDIKPENILLESDHAVVADFGIARAVAVAGGERLTETGLSLGTPAYMSPEQVAGDREVDGRSDVYSLACVIYEMLAGDPPFTASSAHAIIARHLADPPPRLRTVRQTIPVGVEDALTRALAKVPADRPSSAKAFAQALAGGTTAPASIPPAPRLRRRPTPAVRAALIAGGILVAALAWGAWARWFEPSRTVSGDTTDGLPDPRRIAVLYFDDRSQGKELRYLADGLTEGLIRELAQVKALQVISPNGVAPYRDGTVSAETISRTLKAGTLVEGTVAEAGGRLRVSVSLTNPSTGATIGSKSLERPKEDMLALQDDVVREVALFLRERLGEEIAVRQDGVGTQNAEAWGLVQRAQALRRDADQLLEAGDTASASRQLSHADSLLARATDLDPQWATPSVVRSGIAYQRTTLAGTMDKLYYAEWIGKGLARAEQALSLKPGDPDALEVRGTLKYWEYLLNLGPATTDPQRRLAEAEGDLRDAIQANPQQASAWATLSHLLMRRSEAAEGKLAALRAYEADPYLRQAPVILWRLFASSLDLEDVAEAIRWCREGSTRFPEAPQFLECQLSVNALPGSRPEVNRLWQLLDSNVALYPANQREFRRQRGQLFVAMALVRAGLPDSARAVAVRSRADARVDPSRDLVYIEVLLRNMLADRDEALRLVSLYLASNPQDRASMASDSTWWFRGLRDDPRFKRLVAIGR